NRGTIISDFGDRRDPFTGRNAFHSGIDIDVEESTPVYAVLEGKILESSENSENGKYVIIEHKKGLLTYYLHLSKIFVKENLEVSEGEIIGLSGSTGRSKGAHLHFAAKLNNEFVDPELILSNINEFK
ncbi:M23 family metallopeptidase, partial [candidate division KSB1 bacterium]